jgi:hypothetical protein
MDVPALEAAIKAAVWELDIEHRPQWSTPAMEAKGMKPIGCVICFPEDGSWPCVSRMIADDLRKLVE